MAQCFLCHKRRAFARDCGPAAATNVTGSKVAFVGGKSMVDAASTVAQWYLDYAKQLIPSIGIGSGQVVHVVMLDTIRVPTLGEE